MSWRVLVLDQGYEPVKVISWQRAITLVLSGKAEIVEDGDPFNIHTATQTFSFKTIIRQLKSVYRKRKQKIPFTRHNIFLRDNWTCQYCGKIKKNAKSLTWDHVMPRSRGGETSWTNIVTACFPCNQFKANRTPEQAGLKLLHKPFVPKETIALTVKLNLPYSVPESWKTYIDPQSYAYWHVELESS
jgi:5-methylcytosine-specific restriction endonuclease McrA